MARQVTLRALVRSDPYAVFSLLYDQDVHLDIPRVFFRTLWPLLRAARRAGPVLELGCGSGLLTERIAAAGLAVVGVDASRAMLRRARARCAAHDGRVRLVARDFARLHLPPVHPLALACHDVMNHLPSEAALRRGFASARRALAPGGALVFDALTERAFAKYWSDNVHRLEGPHGDLWMDCDWDPRRRRGAVHMTAYVKRGRGRWARHETTLHEWAHGDRRLARALRAAGFDEVWRRPWSAWANARSSEPPERALWCGRLAGAAPVGAAPVSAAVLTRLGFRRVVATGRLGSG
jgi:SAM-dependent methyltransferase